MPGRPELRLLVTGGAGFIGSHIVEEAVREGLEVIVVDDLSSGSPSNLPPGVKLVRADVSDRSQLAAVEAMLRGDDVEVAHLAAVSSVPEAMEDPSRVVRVNVLGTEEVLELARRLDAHVTIASSAAVYGDPSELPLKETSPVRPKSLYGLTKLFDEQLAQQAYRDYGLRYSALRLFNVYGPRMRRGPYASVVYNFITAAIAGARPVIYGDGSATRDFVYVKDVAMAFLLAASRRAVGVFNIGSGVETSVIELLRLVSKVSGVQLEPQFAPPRPGDVSRSFADVSLAREALGWEPRTPLEEGLRATYNYLRSQAPATPS